MNRAFQLQLVRGTNVATTAGAATGGSDDIIGVITRVQKQQGAPVYSSRGLVGVVQTQARELTIEVLCDRFDEEHSNRVMHRIASNRVIRNYTTTLDVNGTLNITFTIQTDRPITGQVRVTPDGRVLPMRSGVKMDGNQLRKRCQKCGTDHQINHHDGRLVYCPCGYSV